MERRKIIYIIIAGLVFLLVIVELVAYLVFRKKDVGLVPDGSSIDRIQTLNLVLRSYFGVNWPVVLGVILCLIIVILILFLFLTKKEVEISDKTYKWATIISVIFMVILSAVAIYGAYNIYKNRPKPDPGDENAQYVDNQRDQLIKFFAAIFGLIFIIIITLGGGLWGFRKMKAKNLV